MTGVQTCALPISNVLMHKFWECISWDECYNNENPIIEFGLSINDEDFRNYVSSRQLFLKNREDNPEYRAYQSNDNLWSIAQWFDRKGLEPKKLKSIGNVYRKLASDYIEYSSNPDLLNYGSIFLEKNSEFQTFNFISGYSGAQNEKIYNDLRDEYVQAHSLVYFAANSRNVPCLRLDNLFKYAELLGIFNYVGRYENINSKVLFSIRSVVSIHDLNSYYLSCRTQEDIDEFFYLSTLIVSDFDWRGAINKIHALVPKMKYFDPNYIFPRSDGEFDILQRSKDYKKAINSFKLELASKIKH